MTIYADKKNGKLTGRFCVEVARKGKRLSKRVNTMEEAKKLQASQEPVGAVQRKDGRGVPRTLKALLRKAEGHLWRTARSGRDNFMKLERLIGLTGDMPIEAFDTLQADRLPDLLEDVAPATRNRYYSYMNTLLKWAARRGYRTAELPEFPWESEASGRIRWITPDEEARMVEILRLDGRSDIASLIECAIATGMRRSEILRLDGKDIEDNWVRLWKTKTDMPRSVPVTLETANALRTLVRQGMPSIARLRYAWDAAKVAMGLEHDREFVFHACRHTCATRLVQANVNLRIIQRFLGHKRIETTVRYAQVNDEMLQRALYQQHRDVVQASLTDARTHTPEIGVRHDTTPGAQVLDFPKAGVAKLVDAQDLGSCGLRPFSVVSLRLARPANDTGET